MDVHNLVSFAGIFILAALAWLLSSDRRNMNWRVIGWGIALQLLMAGFIFRVPAGTRVFLAVNDAVVRVLDSAGAGSRFVFGRLALYVLTLRGQFPTIAGHLISASLLSAPAALVMSKIILPERQEPETLRMHVEPYYEKDSSLFEAIINGADAGVRMVVGIVALLIAVLGLVALVDLGLSSLGDLVNPMLGIKGQWSLRGLFGYLFYPLTLVLGVPLSDVREVSRIIGERLIVTEVASYGDLAVAMKQGLLKDPRSVVITTYALCGFAHIASMAIFVGSACALAPQLTKGIGPIAVRALIAASLACLMTACVAGTFFTGDSILLGGS